IWRLLRQVRRPSIFLHLGNQPALQMSADGGRNVGELDSMLAGIGPYDPAVEFGIEFRSGNTEADQAAHAEGQRLFGGDGRPAQAEVEQRRFDSFVATFHARGSPKLGPVVN